MEFPTSPPQGLTQAQIDAVNSAVSLAASGTVTPVTVGQRVQDELSARDLFRPANMRAGYVSANGNFTASGSFTTTGRIRVDEGVQYFVRYVALGNASAGVVYYNSAGAYLSGAANLASSLFTPPVGAWSMEVSFDGTTTGIRARNQEVYRASALPLESYAGELLDDTHSATRAIKSIASSRRATRDFFSPDDISPAQVVAPTTGVLGANASYSTSNPIQGYPGAVRVPTWAVSGSVFAAFYDRDGNWLYCAGGSGNSLATLGSNQFTVTTVVGGTGSTQLRLPKGSPITSANFPAGTYVVDGPDSGLGTYTLSQNATGGDGVTPVAWSSNGCLRNVPWTYPREAHSATFPMPLNTPYWAQVLSKVPAAGDIFVGPRQELFGDLPCAGDLTMYAGDSLMQSSAAGTGQPTSDGITDGVTQRMLQILTQMNVVQGRGSSGYKLHEILDAAAGFPALDAGAVAGVRRFLEQSGTNSWGIVTSIGAVAQAGVALGVLGDTWEPTVFTGQVTSGQKTITGITVARGALANGMPVVHGQGFVGVGNSLVDMGGGVWQLANNATTTGSATLRGGTFYGDMYDVFIRKLLTWEPKMFPMLAGLSRRFDGTADATNIGAGNYREGDPINNQGAHLSDFHEAKRTFAKAYDLIFFDTFNELGLNSLNQSYYLVAADHLHFKTVGVVEMYVQYLAKKVNSVPRIGKF